LKHLLSPSGHCDVAYDGHEGVAAFRMALEGGRPYDLVCLDIMMPGDDGHRVLDAIRQVERERGVGGLEGVKVVMVTAVDDSQQCVQAFRQGCESYITKPIEEQRLLEAAGKLLGESFEYRKRRQPPNPPRTERYLIVDDDAVCRELLKDMLAPYGQCDFAYDGAEAIEAVRLALEDGAPYGLVCLDIMMPGTSGHQALEEIRKLEAEHGILGLDGVKVIMTTALRDAKHCIQAFREGCESYVTKPISETELLGRMRELGLLEPEPAQG
jgi:two-component system chemotaxis response regulator CheY